MSSLSSRSVFVLAALGLGLSAVVILPHGAGADIESVRAATPPELRGRANPIEPSSENRARAATLYSENCVLCHGPKGDGHGPASGALHPRPMNFSNAEEMAKISDGEMFSAISSGSHGTAMPPFSDRISESDRWRLVAYLREFARKHEEKSD